MPHNAIATGHIDFVLPPEEIAQRLADAAAPTVQDEPGSALTLLPPTTESTESAGSSPRERGKVRELRDELAALKRYVQTVVEEHEAANEELRAASEEVQSSNEELQSTNEELETRRRRYSPRTKSSRRSTRSYDTETVSSTFCRTTSPISSPARTSRS